MTACEKPSMIIVPDVSEDADAGCSPARIVKVFDGDGFLGAFADPNGTRADRQFPCRFAFIDAPEIEQQFGREARDFLNRLLLGKTLLLAPISKESMGGIPLDNYRRLLCMGFLSEQLAPGPVTYYWQGRTRVGRNDRARPVTRNIELEMIVNGWAWVIERYAFEREAEYFAAQDDARRNLRGLWSANAPEPPWRFKNRQRIRTAGSHLSLI